MDARMELAGGGSAAQLERERPPIGRPQQVDLSGGSLFGVVLGRRLPSSARPSSSALRQKPRRPSPLPSSRPSSVPPSWEAGLGSGRCLRPDSSSFDTFLSVMRHRGQQMVDHLLLEQRRPQIGQRIRVVAVEVEHRCCWSAGKRRTELNSERCNSSSLTWTPAFSPISASTRPSRTRRSARRVILGTRLVLGGVLVGQGMAGGLEVAVDLVPDVG